MMASTAVELLEPEMEGGQGGSDHGSDGLEFAAEMMMHRSSSRNLNWQHPEMNSGEEPCWI